MSSSARPSNESRILHVGDIVGVVAKVLNEREVLITAGAQDGVRAGMRFAVLTEMPEPVIDPRNGNELEPVDREKVRIQASVVREKSTICETYQYKSYGGRTLSGLDGILDQFRPPRRVYETFRSTEESHPAPLSDSESYVKINDPVRLIAERSLEIV